MAVPMFQECIGYTRIIVKHSIFGETHRHPFLART
jgi:hypothetical protein